MNKLDIKKQVMLLDLKIRNLLEKARTTKNNKFVDLANRLIDEKNKIIPSIYGKEGHYGYFAFATKPTSDEIALQLSKHGFYPGKPWYYRVWKYIQGMFKGRPKFSRDALEKVEPKE